MTNTDHGLPDVQTDPKPTNGMHRIGVVIGAAVLIIGTALILSLAAWGIVTIWRAILG
ncbi:hypothetical protein NYS48_09665 [Curtobacterium flaccumfaciens pv. flaccumfaciens]|uniref:hypothetical protein n=1 Tax=Curtobacterium poinsettiae TaxID=159612 RepID=UPI00217E76A3|nr:hypothetical protein [Curtobacterium flaccumfaciens]MCS6565579.1 hypothetical protein [Curtobacterium flaccumfaciens pv. flaccumfaciens]